jgi:hypothetical protein
MWRSELAALLQYHRTKDDIRWLRIDPEVFSTVAADLYGDDVHDWAQDLLRIVETFWQRIHPDPATPAVLA